MEIVYHGSSIAGLKRLEPFKCKHDKAYVYATTDYLVVLHFAAKGQGMFDGWVEDDEKNIPTFYEARPNSFKERYYGKSSYCYYLPADTFTSATGDPSEVVSEVGVDVISVKEIKDVGEEFEKFIKEGKFKVIPYNTSKYNTPKKCEKYIIKIPDMEKMRSLSSYTNSDIEQIYLESDPGVTRRIRSRTSSLSTVYTKTVKRRIDSLSCLEDECEIDEDTYKSLSLEMKKDTSPVYKVRHTFVFNSQLFEVDIYPEWQRTCILETELPSRDTEIDFPDFVEIVRDVTGVKEYSNASMSRTFPKEAVIE